MSLYLFLNVTSVIPAARLYIGLSSFFTSIQACYVQSRCCNSHRIFPSRYLLSVKMIHNVYSLVFGLFIQISSVCNFYLQLFIGAEGYNEIGRLVECIHFNIIEPHIMIVFNRILQNSYML
jgi:hypothetical protein